MTFTSDAVLQKTVDLCRERGIRIPTFAQMRDSSLVPGEVRERLKSVGLWEVDPANLFRISWKNEPVETGGGFGAGNWIEFPPALTGVEARIVGIVGKYFPTGAHKVGAAFGCLAPRLVTGQFDPASQKAVWPSTGNYCRGGAFDCALLACHAVAILPQGMSRERFDWLREIGAEVIATPGTESNVKEIYDKCWEIRGTRPDCVIFNQFEEFGNAAWHYAVTGPHVEDVFEQIDLGNSRLAAWVSATGSAGTIGAGDFLRTRFPHVRVVAVEALQCPTLLQAGFGQHRIEGIGDKHVPWIHNVRNTDIVCAIDDELTVQLLRLFNEPEGQEFLVEEGVAEETVHQLPLLGFSSIANLAACIKTAKFHELNSRDVLFTPLTDSADLYGSRLEEMHEAQGGIDAVKAARIFERWLPGLTTDFMKELRYHDRKALHDLKYFTWVEQQGKSSEELRELWEPDFWVEQFAQVEEWDRAIEAFNGATGV